MKIATFRNQFVQNLAPLYEPDEAAQIFYRLLEARQNLKRIDLALQPEAELTPAQQKQWQQDLGRLQASEPVQYIIGVTEFHGLSFKVTPSVLIPRPETEELVDWILSEQPQNTPLHLIDLGTGSGCIAVTLAKNLPAAQVTALDVSQNALDVASENAQNNQVSVRTLCRNILEIDDLGQTYDIIVSNPPYVRNLEKTEIRENVLQHEPHLALFVPDDDALRFYRKIAQLALKNLAPHGKLYFEINQYLGKETMDMLESLGFSKLELRRDLYGNHRMIAAAR